ncbi:MAG: hypothetical protein KKD18_05390 [Nanoarchaeota archaeon]|nr:hypothetical protein [Nanoarchaeota archaeon]MBU0977824.1 hypothetical protein [Nanoarchaeota archaeon]
MIQLAVTKNKGLNLYELVTGLGLSTGNYPYSPSDCFSFHGVSAEREKIFRENKVASLTKLIKTIIPPDKPISGKYLTPDKIVSEVKLNPKYNFVSAVKYAPDIVESGIEKFIAFYLVRDLDEAKGFPLLVEMREVILAAKTHQQITIRGCYRGPNAEASFESSMALLRAQDKRIITNRSCLRMYEYFMNRAFIDGDEDALLLLKELVKDNQKLLPAPDKKAKEVM